MRVIHVFHFTCVSTNDQQRNDSSSIDSIIPPLSFGATRLYSIPPPSYVSVRSPPPLTLVVRGSALCRSPCPIDIDSAIGSRVQLCNERSSAIETDTSARLDVVVGSETARIEVAEVDAGVEIVHVGGVGVCVTAGGRVPA